MDNPLSSQPAVPPATRFSIVRVLRESAPLVIVIALSFAYLRAREQGRPYRLPDDLGAWLVSAGVLALLLVGTFVLLLAVGRLLGMRGDEEWAAERTPEQASAHRRRMLVVWGLLGLAALATWLVPAGR